MAKPALLLIDLQNDYFSGGKFPLYNTEALLTATEKVIAKALQANLPIIYMQHIADGEAAFFNAGSYGAEIHPRLLAAAPDAPIVIKKQADSFYQTELESQLNHLGVDTLWIAGMMTQNCVTYTALSKSAEKYQLCVVSDLCSSVDLMIHHLALRALAIRVPLCSSAPLFSIHK